MDYKESDDRASSVLDVMAAVVERLRTGQVAGAELLRYLESESGRYVPRLGLLPTVAHHASLFDTVDPDMATRRLDEWPGGRILLVRTRVWHPSIRGVLRSIGSEGVSAAPLEALVALLADGFLVDADHPVAVLGGVGRTLFSDRRVPYASHERACGRALSLRPGDGGWGPQWRYLMIVNRGA